MPRPTVTSALKLIDRHGILLVFPIDNRPEPLSLWHCFFPGDEMKWEWSDDGDDRVATLWHLREALSRREEVVYTKWYRSRATFVSSDVCGSLLSVISKVDPARYEISSEARVILEILESDSPLPTKKLRQFSELEGKSFETKFNRAMRELWSRLLIVGRGEVDEGGFPSLAVGSTRVLFEDLWENSQSFTVERREARLEAKIFSSLLLKKQYQKFVKTVEKGDLLF